MPRAGGPRIALDFQPRRPPPLAILALVASLLLATDAWLDERAASTALVAAQEQLDSARQRSERVAARRRESRPELVFSAPEEKALRQAIDAIRVDWPALFGRIERALSEDVSLLAVRPSISGRSVQISGEARHIGALLAFIEALRGAPLSRPTLVSHQLKQNDPQHPIVFEITATWLSAS